MIDYPAVANPEKLILKILSKGLIEKSIVPDELGCLEGFFISKGSFIVPQIGKSN